MPNTMTLIQSYTVGSGGQSSINFSSIPSTYTDLKLLVTLRTNRASAGDYCYVSLNSTAVAAYLQLWYSGTLISVTSTDSYFITADNNSGSNIFSSGELYIPNYNSSIAKSALVDSVAEQNTANSQGVSMSVLRWAVTSPVTSISLTPRFGSLFQQYSTAYLYGIKNS